MSTGKVVVGVLAGVAIGAVLMALMAPDKGSETRKKIVKKGSDAMDDIKEKLDSIISSIGSKVEEVKEKAEHLDGMLNKDFKEIKKTL